MGTSPFFLTGANAKIILNNRTVAYATNLSFTVTVNHTSPRVLGRYEVEAHQPLTYDVEGTLTVIKYGRGLKEYYGSQAPKDVANKGNSIGSYGPPGVNYSTLGLPNTKGQFDGAADEAFNPVHFFQSKMFDIEVRQKVSDSTDGKSAANKFAGAGDELIRNPTQPNRYETSVILLRDCRFSSMKFNLSKKNVAQQTYTFKARYMDDDTFIARKSGVGQELS